MFVGAKQKNELKKGKKGAEYIILIYIVWYILHILIRKTVEIRKSDYHIQWGY